jgi:hypothetical protein
MPGSTSPHYLREAVSRADAIGLFADPRMQGLLAQLPDWLQRFQAVDGFASFEREHAVTIPAALKEFWSRPELVCAWNLTGLYAFDLPEVEQFPSGKYLTFDVLQHSNEPGMVLLDGSDDPPVVLGFSLYDADALPESERGKPVAETLAGYLEDGFERLARRSSRA